MFQILFIIPPEREEKHRDRVSALKKLADKYNWKGVGFPASFNDITTFENNNKVCANIYGYNGEEINPKRLGAIAFVKKR